MTMISVIFFLSTVVLAYGRSCFSLDTMVLMSDGSQKNIGSVKVGDWVMSWDVSQNATVSSVVKELVDGKSDELIVVRKNDMKVGHFKSLDSCTNLPLTPTPTPTPNPRKTQLVSTSDHPYFCHTTQSLMSFSPSVTTSRYHLSETISQMPSDPILQDQFGEPVRTSVDRLWTDAISVRTLKLSNPYHMFFASGVLVHNKGGGSSSSSSSSSSSGRSSSSSTGRTTPTYSYNSPSTYSQRPTGYSQYSSYYYGSSTARRTYYSGSRRGRVDDIYYREHPVTGNVTCCEDDYFYDDMNENTHSQSCGLVTCEADVGGTDDEFEYVISSYGQSTTKYFSSSDDDTIMEKCCECGGGREMMCPDEGESVAAGVGALLILPIFIGIFCCFCMRKKSSSSSATVGPNADSGFQKFSEPTVWATPPGTYNCFKCSQPCQWKVRGDKRQALWAFPAILILALSLSLLSF